MSKIVCFATCCLCFALALGAQTPEATTTSVEMADTLRQSGKIYVVVASVAIIFIGIVLFLFRLERRIQQLERPS